MNALNFIEQRGTKGAFATLLDKIHEDMFVLRRRRCRAPQIFSCPAAHTDLQQTRTDGIFQAQER